MDVIPSKTQLLFQRTRVFSSPLLTNFHIFILHQQNPKQISSEPFVDRVVEGQWNICKMAENSEQDM